MATRKSLDVQDDAFDEPVQKRPPVWVYGINDHLDVPDELPAGFVTSGMLCDDFRRLCKAVDAAPHPAFKVRQPVSTARSRRPSIISPNILGSSSAPSAPPPPVSAPGEGPVFSIRSMLLDKATMGLMGLLLPTVAHIKALCLSDCRLDGEMLRLLRRGLSDSTSVESLQIEWNPFELPLPLAEEMEEGGGAEEAAVSGGAPFGDGCDIEARERHRYCRQSQRGLFCFREWLEACFDGSMDGAWAVLATAGADMDASLSAGDFHDMLKGHIGASGPQIAEVFEVLDGPDYAAGQGCISLGTLRRALEALPEEPAVDAANDPVGLMLTPFIDCGSVLESFSLRSCALGRLEVTTMAAALAQCPWQLRCLNLWDNRICDRGAEALAAALSEYRGLQYLGLGRNRITDVGFSSACQPFNTVVLDEAGLHAARERIKQQMAHKEATAKAAAKAKARAATPDGRERRQTPLEQDELVERPAEEEGGEPTFILRRPCELRTLVLSENPIKSVKRVEDAQPRGPRGAELLLRNTAAAATLLVKRPDLASKEKRPLGEGWVLRLV